MKKYEIVEMEVIAFDKTDVITASGATNDSYTDSPANPWGV